MLPDVGTPRPDEADRIGQWIESGGVAVRFAGPLLAAHPDALVPVPLRAGDRVLSGALSWSEPAALAPSPPPPPPPPPALAPAPSSPPAPPPPLVCGLWLDKKKKDQIRCEVNRRRGDGRRGVRGVRG